MRIFGLNLGGEHWTTPYPTRRFGMIVRLLGGNVVQPLGDGDWFAPPYFARVLCFFMPLPVMPFIAIRCGRFGVYVGAKVFGVDSPAYAEWMAPSTQVYPGSTAMMLCSIRFTRNLS